MSKGFGSQALDLNQVPVALGEVRRDEIVDFGARNAFREVK